MRVFEKETLVDRGFSRRRFLRLVAIAAAGASVPLPAVSASSSRWGLPGGYSLDDIPVAGGISNRAVVIRPAASPSKPLPVLILIHGLAETKKPRDGVYAWVERYGLGSSLARLVEPPVERGLARRRFLSDERAQALNERLSRRPFGEVMLVCPYAPNMYKTATRRALDRYGDWIAAHLLPTVRERFGGSDKPALTAIDGCSFGGFVSLEVFVRRPELFGAVGGIQAAVGKAAVDRYANRLAAAFGEDGARPVFLATSSHDPYRDAISSLAKELEAKSLEVDLVTTKGPHGPRWLAEVGVLEMLAWHEARFAQAKAAPSGAPGGLREPRAGDGR